MRTDASRTPAALLVALLVAFAGLGAAPAQAQTQLPFELGKIGVLGGVNLERVGDIESGGSAASLEGPIGGSLLGGSAGYHVGVSYDQPLGPVYVRPGFVARRAGAFHFPTSPDNSTFYTVEGQSFNVWVFEIPVDVRYQHDLGAASVYAFGGPMLAIPRAEQDFDASFPNAVLAAEGGIGGEFDLPDLPVVLAPELRYSYSITKTVKSSFQLRGRTFETDGLRFNGPSFRLHVYYPLNF